jgi:nicotinamide riboside transporter PnuC
LEPVERISAFLFGLIMVLTLTRTFNVSETYRSGIRTLLMDALVGRFTYSNPGRAGRSIVIFGIAVVAVAVLLGIIDAFFYLLTSLAQRGHGAALLKQLRRTSEPGEARRMVA